MFPNYDYWMKVICELHCTDLGLIKHPNCSCQLQKKLSNHILRANCTLQTWTYFVAEAISLLLATWAHDKNKISQKSRMSFVCDKKNKQKNRWNSHFNYKSVCSLEEQGNGKGIITNLTVRNALLVSGYTVCSIVNLWGRKKYNSVAKCWYHFNSLINMKQEQNCYFKYISFIPLFVLNTSEKNNDLHL